MLSLIGIVANTPNHHRNSVPTIVIVYKETTWYYTFENQIQNPKYENLIKTVYDKNNMQTDKIKRNTKQEQKRYMHPLLTR